MMSAEEEVLAGQPGLRVVAALRTSERSVRPSANGVLSDPSGEFLSTAAIVAAEASPDTLPDACGRRDDARRECRTSGDCGLVFPRR